MSVGFKISTIKQKEKVIMTWINILLVEKCSIFFTFESSVNEKDIFM